MLCLAPLRKESPGSRVRPAVSSWFWLALEFDDVKVIVDRPGPDSAGGVGGDVLQRGWEPGDGLAARGKLDHGLETPPQGTPGIRLCSCRDRGNITGTLDHLQAFSTGRVPDPRCLVP